MSSTINIMKLIADSGSTKTEWCFIQNKRLINRLKTKGINPYYQQEESIIEEIKKSVAHIATDKVNEIFFYGAGCTEEKKNHLNNALMSIFPNSTIEVHSDLLGASRAMCQQDKGIVAILGTGSNSALYQDGKIISNTPPLGFILGDEGSGASLGRDFINLLFKNQLPQSLQENFLQEYNTTLPQIIENVYQKPFPNRFLAHFVPFIKKHIENKEIYNMVKMSFDDFLKKNIFSYPNAKKYPIHFVGSVAFYFQTILEEVVLENQLIMGNVEKSPLNKLIEFHLE